MAAILTIENLAKRFRHGRAPGFAGMPLSKSVLSGSKSILNKFLGRAGAAKKTAPAEWFWALRDVSFQVQPGDRVGIIGRNGAGKSTLLKLVARVLSPTEGRITTRGRIASLLEVGTGFHPDLSGRENVFFNGAILGFRRPELVRRFDEIVAFAGVERFIDMPVKRYSSGMYTRLAFAVAAHLEPDLLIVDEVLAVGDAVFQEKCLAKMREFSAEGRTILLVSHNLGTISATCNKALLLTDGKAQGYGSTSQIMAQYTQVAGRALTRMVEPGMRDKCEGNIQILRCSISDTEGIPKNAFLIGENIKLALQVRFHLANQSTFWMIIYDSLGRPLLNSHQRDANEWFELQPQDKNVFFETKDLQLMPGHYSISAGAFGRQMEIIEHVDSLQHFEVLPSFRSGAAYDGRMGVSGVRSTWTLG